MQKETKMDEQKVDLALAFLQSQPAEAAAILEQQPLEQVADFLGGLPHTYGAMVMAKMLPQYSARLCRELPPTIAAGILSGLDTSLVATVMRQCRGELGKQLLELLPDKTRLACRLLLNYSEDAVGAWMNAGISTLPDDCTAGEALDRIRRDPATLDTGVSLVVDRERYLRGLVSPASLLRVPANTAIATVMVSTSESISARTALKSAADNPLWEERDSIPVTNRNRKLVGLLRHLDLRNGLQQISASVQQARGGDAITGVFEVYGNSLLILFTAMSEIARGRTRPRR